MPYNNPTLEEIYVEFYLEENSMLIGPIFDASNLMKKIELTEIEVHQAVSDTGDNVNLVPRIRCWSKDKTRLVQMSQDIIIINQLKKYNGWKELIDFIKRSLDVLGSVVKEIKIKSISLNTIDKFSVPAKEFDLSKWLNCNGGIVPAWFKNTKTSCDLTLGEGFIKEDKKNRQVLMQVRKKDETFSLRVHSVFHDLLLPDDKPFEKLETLNQESCKSFEAIITEEVRKTIMGGKK